MNRRRRGLWAILGTLALTACAVGPDFTVPPAPTQKGYTALPVTLSQAGAGLPEQSLTFGATASTQWWRQFNSSTLNTTVALALSDSPTLKQARATLAQAQQSLRAAQAALYPQIDLGAGVSRARMPAVNGSGSSDLFSVGPLVSYSVDGFGGTRRLIEQQSALADVQREQLAAAHLAITGSVVAQAIGIAAARDQTAAVEAVLAVDQQDIELVKLSVQSGISAAGDLVTAQSQLAADEALLPPLRQQRAAAENALAMLVGRSAATWNVPRFGFDALTLPANLPVVIPSALVRVRPDIRAAEAQLHAASAAIGVTTAGLYPQISLSASWTQQAATMGALFDGANGLWAVAASLTAPIFHGGALRAQQQAAIDAFNAQLAAYRQTVLVAFNQVADVLQALEHDAQLIAAQRRALDSASESLRLARDSYAAGAGTFLQVLTAQRIYQQARLGYARAISQRYVDTVHFFAAMGGGSALPPARLD
ncbi:MAG: efflux transporter outer membrane subunit [Proteobacteria bacterium]|nr:efflux transporter outer membrane subunit [Pseudomonadota bacterium]